MNNSIKVAVSDVQASALDGCLELEDGAVFERKSFGSPRSVAGEVVLSCRLLCDSFPADVDTRT